MRVCHVYLLVWIVCTCTYGRYHVVCMHVGSMIDSVSVFPQLLSTFIFLDTWSLSKPEVHEFSRDSWPMGLRVVSVSSLQHWSYRRMPLTDPSFSPRF